MQKSNEHQAELLKVVITYKGREKQNRRDRNEKNSCECTYNISLIFESVNVICKQNEKKRENLLSKII